jgi:hypothetical protein
VVVGLVRRGLTEMGLEHEVEVSRNNCSEEN